MGALRTTLAAALLAFLPFVAAYAATTFPELTGRIVDQAQIIDAASKTAIDGKLVDFERTTGVQIAVATVTSLDGQEIEPYALDLFNFWGLGHPIKNDGVLLLVAPNEHRVRIEVGTGLEGQLTNAACAEILKDAVLPRFKAADFSSGIAGGIDGIIGVLRADAINGRATSQPVPAATTP